MKVISTVPKKTFQPVSITITFESEEEMKILMNRLKPMGNSQRIQLGLERTSVRQGNDVFRPIMERLDKLIENV